MAENVALAARMTELGIGATQLARTLDITERTVCYWLAGTITWPNEPTRSKVIKYLRVSNPADLGFIHPHRRYLGHTSYDVMIVPDGRDWTPEAATNRRDALRAGGAALAGLTGLSMHQAFSEPDHMTSALAAGSVDTDRLTQLERTTDELAAGVITSAKPSLLGETLGTFASVRRLVRQRQRTADQVRLIRSGSKLALVAGEILFDQHQFRLADRWNHTARLAALDIGDAYLADVAIEGMAFVPAYSGDPKGVLTLVSPRLESTPTPTAATASLWAAAARAHAVLGEESAFRDAVDRSRRILDAIPRAEDDPLGFSHRRLAFYQTTGCVKLRDAPGAIAAADRALRLYRAVPGANASERVMVRLDRASALALSGEIDEACRQATAALADGGAAPSASVLIRAAEFDALLGADRSLAVGDWRDTLRAARQPG